LTTFGIESELILGSEDGGDGVMKHY